MKNHWKYIVMALLGGVVIFHVSALVYISGEDYELTSRDYYQSQLDYEQTLEAMRAAKAYRWRCDFEGEAVVLQAVDPSGAVVAFDQLKAKLYKPDAAALDRPLDFTFGDDRYRAEIGEVKTGLWRVMIEAEHDGKPLVYRTALRR